MSPRCHRRRRRRAFTAALPRPACPLASLPPPLDDARAARRCAEQARRWYTAATQADPKHAAAWVSLGLLRPAQSLPLAATPQ